MAKGSRDVSEAAAPEEVARLLSALADAARLRILALLRTGDRCVCEIHTSLGLSPPTSPTISVCCDGRDSSRGDVIASGCITSWRGVAWRFFVPSWRPSKPASPRRPKAERIARNSRPCRPAANMPEKRLASSDCRRHDLHSAAPSV